MKYSLVSILVVSTWPLALSGLIVLLPITEIPDLIVTILFNVFHFTNRATLTALSDLCGVPMSTLYDL
jgi:hypothetical protein